MCIRDSDLAGHTANNRLRVFAQKPAPIQVSAYGYFNTTWLTTMDYIISDKYLSPPQDDHLYTETVYRMPHGYICYNAPPYLPDVSELPALKNGYLTFGSSNKLAKLTTDTIQLWSELLHALPTSKLICQAPALENEEIAQRFIKLSLIHI